MLNKTASLDRRAFMQAAGVACVANAIRPALAQPGSAQPDAQPLPLPLGVIRSVAEGQSIDDAIAAIHAMGFPTCQIGFEHLTAAVAGPLKNALAKYGVEATALSEHGPGRCEYDFYHGPNSVGIIPPATRQARIRNLQLAADIAAQCGIPAIHTHCGFIPEDPNQPLYAEAVAAVKTVAVYCKQRGRSFLCETGQETPITLLRLIDDVGMDNVFVNFDLANLILYGKGNPVDAMDAIGSLVRGIHAKDGLFPTDPRKLGEEVKIGQGKVDFPAVFALLRQAGYQGAVTIEREIQGAQQREDILQSKIFLEGVIRKAYS